MPTALDLLVVGDANPDLILTGDVRPRFGQVESLVDDAALVLGGSGRSRRAAPRSWGSELLRSRDGRFVLIDWPGLGAAPRGSQAALAPEILLRFEAADPAPLMERFFAGRVPAGL